MDFLQGAIATTRLSLGVIALYSILSSEEDDQKKLASLEQKDLVRDLMERVGYNSHKMVVHSIGATSSSATSAYSSYDPFHKIATIGLPNDSRLDISEIRWMTLHELGHLSYHHPEMILAILLYNLVIFSIPYFSIKDVVFSFFSSLFLIFIFFQIMERQADAFAFHHSTLQELQKIEEIALNKKKGAVSKSNWMTFFLEKFLHRSEERIFLLHEAILKKSIS